MRVPSRVVRPRGGRFRLPGQSVPAGSESRHGALRALHHAVARLAEESTKDADEALDAIMHLEEAKQQTVEEHYANEKQQLLNAEKAHIRDIVRSALEPVFATLRDAA